MDRESIQSILQAVAEGRLNPTDAATRISEKDGLKMGFAHLDLGRPDRTGTPEVVYGAGKTAHQIATLLRHLYQRGQVALATRVDSAKAEIVQGLLADLPLQWHPIAGVMELRDHPPEAKGCIAVVSAGTSDLPVAEEVAVIAAALGSKVERIDDVGIAGLHRILGQVDALRRARVVVVIAGMDGALPAVVAGLVAAPVIGVPTSVGYGVAFGGVAPLLTMLNACSPGVAVVNIDNGFGAAMIAHRINRTN